MHCAYRAYPFLPLRSARVPGLPIVLRPRSPLGAPVPPSGADLGQKVSGSCTRDPFAPFAARATAAATSLCLAIVGFVAIAINDKYFDTRKRIEVHVSNTADAATWKDITAFFRSRQKPASYVSPSPWARY